MFCCFLLLLLILNNQSIYSTVLKHETLQKILCYTCMSNNVPNVTKVLMAQYVTLPDNAESQQCHDPFLTSQGRINDFVELRECRSGCIKVTAENKYLKVLIRGCSDNVFVTEVNAIGFFPTLIDNKYSSNCIEHRDKDAGVETTITKVCACSSHFCNRSFAPSLNLFMLPFCFCLLTIPRF